VGGCFAVLPRVPVDRMVVVRATLGAKTWLSKASPLQYFVELHENAGT
jgi:hypothetical protein